VGPSAPRAISAVAELLVAFDSREKWKYIPVPKNCWIHRQNCQ